MAAPRTEEPSPTPEPDARASLTARELTVLQLLARGYSFAQCAQLTGAAGTETLAAAQDAARMLGVPDTTAAVFEAYRLELLV